MSDSTNVYQAIQVQVSNASAGQQISVELIEDGNSPIGWSTGKDYQIQQIYGISVWSQSGSLPLVEFDVNTSTLSFVTQQGNGGDDEPLEFTVDAYLVAGKGIQTFYMTGNSDPSVAITAAIGDSQPQTVNQSPTLFPWKQQ